MVLNLTIFINKGNKMQKLYDVTVKTGEYTNGHGEKKGRYENIGSMMQGDNGPFLILKRTFNPAGVPNPECKDSVICSLFEPNQANNGNQSPQQQSGYSQPQHNQAAQQGGFAPHQQVHGQPQNQGGFAPMNTNQVLEVQPQGGFTPNGGQSPQQ